MSEPDLLAALGPVVDLLDRLGVPYQIGGSVASSVYGMARATMDVDLVADLDATHVTDLVETLQADYFVDAGMVRTALRQRSSFNLIHQATMMKIDVFLPKGRPYDREALARSVEDTLVDEPSARRVSIASAEDVVLSKLEWYRLGGEVSERQWADVLGILRVQGNALDRDYMRRWALELGVDDLLGRALGDA